ncbi:MAG: hypothetical protein ACE5FD_17925, partial [Anaerolineae bacterium]
ASWSVVIRHGSKHVSFRVLGEEGGSAAMESGDESPHPKECVSNGYLTAPMKTDGTGFGNTDRPAAQWRHG